MKIWEEINVCPGGLERRSPKRSIKEVGSSTEICRKAFAGGKGKAVVDVFITEDSESHAFLVFTTPLLDIMSFLADVADSDKRGLGMLLVLDWPLLRCR